MADSQSDWFSDPAILVEEIRRSSADTTPPTPEIPGYADLLVLARGGQGVVYLATQVSTKRRVAIKTIAPESFADDSRRRRFEREIEIVASLRHDGIVRVFDSGMTADDRLFLVMERIDGAPLDEWSRDRTVPEVIDLFISVVEAVAHAHQRGVIHRDLKPGNIRVDSSGRARVLDFGLAKALDPSVSTVTAVTEATAPIFGSLPYMSPEQARGEVDAVDVRSDIYALGVVLFEMLTRQRPYPVDRGIRDALNTIVSVDPTPPRSVNPAVDADLNTIVLKCLAKEPTRRYQSAGELADDLRRWRSEMPILARRDTIWYRTTKLARRRPGAVLGGSGVIVALLVGVALVGWQWGLRVQERNRRFDDVRRLANSLVIDLHDAAGRTSGPTVVRELMVQRALEYLRALSIEGDDNPALQRELAVAYLKIGDVQGRPNAPNLGDTTGALQSYRAAQEILEQLLTRIPDDPETLHSMSESHAAIGDVFAWQGRLNDGVSELRTALEFLVRRTEVEPGAAAGHRALAVGHIRLADLLGNPHFPNVGEIETAMDHYGEAMDLVAQMLAEDEEGQWPRRYTGLLHERLATMHERAGETALAREASERSLQFRAGLVEDDPANATYMRDLGIAHEKIGDLHRREGNSREAAASYERASTIFDQLVTADPANANAIRTAALTHERLGHLLLGEADAEGAARQFRRAVDGYETLTNLDPANARSRQMLAIGWIILGDALGSPEGTSLGRHDEAVEHYQWAGDAFESLLEIDPQNQTWRRYAALAIARAARIHLTNGDTHAAVKSLRESLRRRDALALEWGGDYDIERDAALARLDLGIALQDSHELAEARTLVADAQARLLELVADFPERDQLRQDLSRAVDRLDSIDAQIELESRTQH
ncbi:MAG: protein kinase [Phycisphaerales bacterium]